MLGQLVTPTALGCEANQTAVELDVRTWLAHVILLAVAGPIVAPFPCMSTVSALSNERRECSWRHTSSTYRCT